MIELPGEIQEEMTNALAVRAKNLNIVMVGYE